MSEPTAAGQTAGRQGGVAEAEVAASSAIEAESTAAGQRAEQTEAGPSTTATPAPPVTTAGAGVDAEAEADAGADAGAAAGVVQQHEDEGLGESADRVEALGAAELDNDADSMFSGGNSLNSTESLSASIFEYRKLHGRTYQANRDHWAPNDDQHNEGLDLLHHALTIVRGDKLFLAPLGPNPGRVLDIGTGTGIWAIDFADQFPGAEVIGTDITPTQPTWVPPNLRFVIDDCEEEWTWPEDHFDFVHIQFMYGAIANWEKLYQQAFVHTKPGGWFEAMDSDVLMQSDHVDLGPNHIFYEWADLFYKAGDITGRTFRIAVGHTMADLMRAAGFVDVVERKIRQPCHGWPRDPRLRTAGHLVQAGLEEALDGFALYLFTQVLGWSKEETIVFVAKVRAEVRKRSNCHYCMATIVYGRKPYPGELV